MYNIIGKIKFFKECLMFILELLWGSHGLFYHIYIGAFMSPIASNGHSFIWGVVIPNYKGSLLCFHVWLACSEANSFIYF